MSKSLFFLFAICTLCSAGCQAKASDEQLSAATAYAEASMQEAMEAAEESALALCALDFESGAEAYSDSVCALSTDLACALLQSEVQETWTDLQQAYAAPKMACAPSSSRLLEEGRQYGKYVQFWRVNLKGTMGFNNSDADQVYWLQVAEENGKWKFNRLLSQSEIALYLSMQDSEK